MTIFNVFALLGGLAMFLYGMNIMGNALEKSAGSRLKDILATLTKNTLSGFLLGLVVTAVIQSSSATTVMVVGFVNSGVMTLKQSIGVIMGANVGTSVTAWILSLAGIDGDAWYIQLLKPDSFTPIFAFVGIILFMFCKRQKLRDIAPIFLGFAILMYGMDFMSGAVAPLSESESFRNVLLLFTNPLLGVLAGAVMTAIIQSSSASVGILQALSLTGAINYGAVIPIVMGQNIGTCVTALISSTGTSKNARRAAVVHLSFNVISTIIILPIFSILNAIFDFEFVKLAATPLGIAIFHSAFNVIAVMILMPMSALLEKVAHLVVRDGKNDGELNIPDIRLLATPPVAVGACRSSARTMSTLSAELVERAFKLLDKYDEKEVAVISQGEDDVDKYEDALGSYLVKLSGEDLSPEDAAETSTMLHVIGDFERISDHAKNIADSCVELHEKKLAFSAEAMKEISVLKGAVAEAMEMAVKAYETGDITTASLVEPIEQVVDKLKDSIRARHIERLKAGDCTIELGFVLTDLLTNFERIADHSSNIAVSVIDIKNKNFDSHAYLNRVKHSSDEFNSLYAAYEAKYRI
ncbi:MAG: Na/Pi cotransporter family protein [Clostridia bacterium]|nr:Na/Pi cotransporter family protein [Clostridia bacterium]